MKKELRKIRKIEGSTEYYKSTNFCSNFNIKKQKQKTKKESSLSVDLGI